MKKSEKNMKIKSREKMKKVYNGNVMKRVICDTPTPAGGFLDGTSTEIHSVRNTKTGKTYESKTTIKRKKQKNNSYNSNDDKND